MSFKENDNSGAIFVNDRKESDKHPDWNGKGMIDGKPVWISGWKKDGQKGRYISLSFKERDPSQKTKTTNRERPRHEDDSDIPW